MVECGSVHECSAREPGKPGCSGSEVKDSCEPPHVALGPKPRSSGRAHMLVTSEPLLSPSLTLHGISLSWGALGAWSAVILRGWLGSARRRASALLGSLTRSEE